MSEDRVISIVIAGIGGQGIITASDILSGALHRAGYDVKKSEIHGMSQRGGSVCSDIRFGKKVLSPMVPVGTADFLVIMEPTQVGPNQHMLSPTGVLITPDDASYVMEQDEDNPDPRAEKLLNVALLGVLSAYVDVPQDCWLGAMRDILPPKLHDMNIEVFNRAYAVESVARLVKDASKPTRR